jgi:putative endonuclease
LPATANGFILRLQMLFQGKHERFSNFNFCLISLWYAYCMSQPYTLELGFAGERAAADWYKDNGFSIVALNYFNRRGKRVGEIDFIATRVRNIHFVEVKSRVSHSTELALEQVNQPKQMRLLMAIRYFLLMNQKYMEYEQHIDVAVVLFSQFDKSTPRVNIYPDVIFEV